MERFEVCAADCGFRFYDVFDGPIPPCGFKQGVDCGVVEPAAQNFGGVAGDDAVGGMVPATTAPAPMIQPEPMLAPGRIFAPAPNQTS